MEKNTQLLEIIKGLNDNRNKLSALFSLYNSSLLLAEENRVNIGNYFEQMIDLKNDITTISNEIYALKKSERKDAFAKNKMRIKKMSADVNQVNMDFQDSCEKYKIALEECGNLKSEYKHEVSRLCKEFKEVAGDDIEPIVVKGYKQQVRIIKAILEKIEFLISDYNVKRNKVEQDDIRFADLHYNVSELLNRLQEIA